ncbi:hypothetical protein K402DRAFT_447506 [Aulographum hederae CBS 113979]|uniref:Uncharacterized protein n=1 Tax=Aulographum hederae CBS 113979 TaxID=1176131 RepID=A0A6G1GVK1_9PEZI|nr:hypothetical protein K402DRAFT_447506 [Aulographum hederae CBS 113979]
MANSLYLPLYVLLGLLMVDAITEVGFVGSMVGYLHDNHGNKPFEIQYTAENGIFLLPAKPTHPIVDQGHTSNGAAGTALVLVGILGYVVLWLKSRPQHMSIALLTRPAFLTWVVLTVLSFLLTLAALAYTFTVTHSTSNQTIDLSAPGNWYKAVLELQFQDPNEKGDIRNHIRLMEGWRWNLIPLFLLGGAIAVLAVWMAIKERKGAARQVYKETRQTDHFNDATAGVRVSWV